MLVAPTEPTALRALGKTSSAPERSGADVLWAARAGLVGIQRKVFPSDFLDSVTDGRLARETAQARALDVSVLVLEGRGSWTTDGVLMTDWGQTWTRSQHRRFLWSMRVAGWWVEWTDNLGDTISLVSDLCEWSKKARHESLLHRPKAKGAWGKPSDREWGIHLLQGFEGVGPETAARILDHFGGLPLHWAVGEKELLEVHGVGKVTAGKMLRGLSSSSSVSMNGQS